MKHEALSTIPAPASSGLLEYEPDIEGNKFFVYASFQDRKSNSLHRWQNS